MRNAVSGNADVNAVNSELIDLDGLVLADIDALDRPVLVRALRRVLTDPGVLDEPIAAFQSFI